MCSVREVKQRWEWGHEAFEPHFEFLGKNCGHPALCQALVPGDVSAQKVAPSVESRWMEGAAESEQETQMNRRWRGVSFSQNEDTEQMGQ